MSSDRKRHRNDAPAAAERSSRRARLVQFLTDPSMRRILASLGFRFSIDNSTDALVDVDGLISASHKHGRTADGATFLLKPAADQERTKWKTQVEDVTAKLQAAETNVRTLEHDVQRFRRHQDPKELTEAVHRAARLERDLEAMKRVKNEGATEVSKIERLVDAGKATRHLLEAIRTVVQRNKRSL